MSENVEKKNNTLRIWGNGQTMNLNNIILTNILSSHYFKVNLYKLKTYHEVIDEIYFKVNHLEPWEKGSRHTMGQTGMCGSVRGVAAGGIVSTAFSILYKLFTLKLTRKQVLGLINHSDSPYIRALGFMYIRYTQPPTDLWDWYEKFLADPEEIDVKAGSGQIMTIGKILQHFLFKLEWFSTLFPRIPVPIQKHLEDKFSEWHLEHNSENRSNVDRMHNSNFNKKQSWTKDSNDEQRVPCDSHCRNSSSHQDFPKHKDRRRHSRSPLRYGFKRDQLSRERHQHRDYDSNRLDFSQSTSRNKESRRHSEKTHSREQSHHYDRNYKSEVKK